LKCSKKYCRNERAHWSTLCHKCRSVRFKTINAPAYFFNALRGNAKKRNKEFLLTLDQFKQFCNDTGYLEKKGKNGSSLSIDRIDAKGPYSINNIQALTLRENTIKENTVDYPF
jgi:hypothetical protein